MSNTNMLLIIIKAIGLLVVESRLTKNPNISTINIIRDILDNLNFTTTQTIESSDDRLKESYGILSELLDDNSKLDTSTTSDRIYLTFKGDPVTDVYKGVVDTTDDEKSAIRTYRYLNKIRTDLVIKKIISNTDFKLGQPNQTNILDIAENLITRINDVKKTIESDNEKSSISINDKGAITEIFKDVKNIVNSDSKLKTAFKAFNEMLQGGFSPGELIMYQSLQHKYKSGMTVTMLLSACLFNKPTKENETIVYISFEDPLVNTFMFMYNFLYSREHNGTLPNVKETPPEVMEEFVMSRLTRTGFNVEFIKANPSDWNYKRLFQTTDKIANNIGPIRILLLDYLAKMPTTGCLMTGGTGSDMRDLYRRTRNHYSSTGTTVWTPHQIGPKGKDLLAGGLPDASFVKRVNGAGMASISSQLDQEVDVEVNGHKVVEDGYSFLTIGLGKHRTPLTVAEKYKFFVLPFPERGPILDDVEKETYISSYTFDEAFVKASSDTNNGDVGDAISSMV